MDHADDYDSEEEETSKTVLKSIRKKYGVNPVRQKDILRNVTLLQAIKLSKNIKEFSEAHKFIRMEIVRTRKWYIKEIVLERPAIFVFVVKEDLSSL